MKRHFKLFLLMNPFAWLWTTVSGQNCVLTDSSFTSRVDSLIQRQMQEQKIVGLSAGLLRNGEVVFMKGYGMADLAYQIPAEVNTMYRMASISKTITAVAVLHAAEQGLIDLQADVRQYVPEYPEKPEGIITIQHLLNCEGGLQQYDQITPFNQDALVSYIMAHPNDYDPIAAIDIFKDQQLIAAPGKMFNYSTFSFNLLAAALERATGMAYEDYVDALITHPMNLPFLQPEWRGAQPYPNQASWYISNGDTAVLDRNVGPDYEDVSWKLGGGGYTGTIVDLAGFARALMNGSLIQKATMKTMFTSSKVKGLKTYYGLGVFLGSRNGKTVVSQFGHQAGARSIIYLIPETQDGVVILSNTYGTDLMPMAKGLYDLMDSMPASTVFCENPFPKELAIPVWRGDADDLPSKYKEVQLLWEPVEHAYAYEVEWSLDPDFKETTTEMVKADHQLTLSDLPADSMAYFRLRALNDYLYGGIVGPWSTTQARTTGSAEVATELPLNFNFDGPTFICEGSRVLWEGNGISWKTSSPDSGLRIRGGRRSLSMSAGGWTVDLLPGHAAANNYIDLTLHLSDFHASRLLFRLDYMLHVYGEAAPTIHCWMRSNEAQPWVEVPNAFPVGGNAGLQQTEFDLLQAMGPREQGAGASCQVRFGVTSNQSIQYPLPQAVMTLLHCSVTGVE
jgi:CubicO group peptidase (beta-lactamase class C family)